MVIAVVNRWRMGPWGDGDREVTLTSTDESSPLTDEGQRFGDEGGKLAAGGAGWGVRDNQMTTPFNNEGSPFGDEESESVGRGGEKRGLLNASRMRHVIGQTWDVISWQWKK